MDSSAKLQRQKLVQQARLQSQSPVPVRLRSGSQNSNPDKFCGLQSPAFPHKFAQMQRTAARQARSRPSLQVDRHNTANIEQLQQLHRCNFVRPSYGVFGKDSRELTDLDTRSPTFDHSTACSKKPGPQIGTCC